MCIRANRHRANKRHLHIWDPPGLCLIRGARDSRNAASVILSRSRDFVVPRSVASGRFANSRKKSGNVWQFCCHRSSIHRERYRLALANSYNTMENDKIHERGSRGRGISDIINKLNLLYDNYFPSGEGILAYYIEIRILSCFILKETPTVN